MTLLVMEMSDFTKNYFHWLILALIAAVLALRQVRRTPKGRDAFDRLLLRVPVFGMLIRKVAVARFTRTLGTMLSSGVPILDGLEIVAATAGNALVERAIRNARNSSRRAARWPTPCRTGVFPPMVTQMIAVGEATGLSTRCSARLPIL